MAILDNIEVRIWSDGKLLTEYEDPDERALQDRKTVTKFIEATPGAQFSIEVLLKRGYKFYGADCVRIRRRMDGQSCTARLIQKSASGDSVTQALTEYIDSETQFDQRTEQWIQSSFSFGQVKLVEHGELPDGLDPQVAMKLGTIELICYRVHRKLRPVPLPFDKHFGFTSVDQTSEKILKGKAVENNIRYANERVISQPAARTHKSVPADVPYGTPTVFEFHYRSHRALQILGCVPRSESPTIVIQDDEEAEKKPVLATSDLENTELEISQRAKERERLQAELAMLDRLDQAARGVKMEAGHNGNTSGEHKTVPRLERELEENDVRIKREESGSRKRSRTSGPIETVDLTAD